MFSFSSAFKQWIDQALLHYSYMYVAFVVNKHWSKPHWKISCCSVAAWAMLFKSAVTSPKVQAASFRHVSACTGYGYRKGILVALISSSSVLLLWQKPNDLYLYQPNLKSSFVIRRKGKKSAVFSLGVSEAQRPSIEMRLLNPM